MNLDSRTRIGVLTPVNMTLNGNERGEHILWQQRQPIGKLGDRYLPKKAIGTNAIFIDTVIKTESKALRLEAVQCGKPNSNSIAIVLSELSQLF